MPSQIQLKGAQSRNPSHLTPIYTARFFQGLYTNRNPLRDAGSTHLEESFYGARGDGLIDGLNTEISVRLTLVRRPGLSVYNTQTFPPINSFYEFRMFDANTEQIKVLADTASALYDATGPTNKTTVFTKSSGAGQTYMQSVGNTLYFGNGVDQRKWVQSLKTWQPNTQYNQGDYIIDPNGYVQQALGSQTGNIAGVVVLSNIVIVYLDQNTPVEIPNYALLHCDGLTEAIFLNGFNLTPTVSSETQFFQGSFPRANYPYIADTGTVTTGTGISGTVQPSWNPGHNAVTQDGLNVVPGVQWVNRGTPMQAWGVTTPKLAPTVTQTSDLSIPAGWQAHTAYYPVLSILDTNDTSVHILYQSGNLGGSEPAWNNTIGGFTNDGSAIWRCCGVWQRGQNKAYNSGTVIAVQWGSGGGGGTENRAMFACVASGVTANVGYPAIDWSPTPGDKVLDGTVTWLCIGPIIYWPDLGAGQSVQQPSEIIDPNGYLQRVSVGGKSGGSAPAWTEAIGANTVDGTITWSNLGQYPPPSTAAWTYAYSYVSSLSATVSTASPLSRAITRSTNMNITITGPGSSDPQVDSVYIWRTVEGGSTLFYLGKAPIRSNNTWGYIDTIQDTALNNLITAPVAFANDPPPKGIQYLTYHLGRVWGAINNSVYWSAGPDALTGNGAEAWPASNVFIFPSSVKRLFPCAVGVLVFTNSDVYLISGLGTTASPFISLPYISGLGLLSYNAFDVNGTTVYMFTSDLQVVSLDLTSGVSEVSFPIGDKFLSWDPSKVGVTWFISGSLDKGLYVTDRNSGWYRMCPTPAPETGLTWSPFAMLAGGCSSVQSVETSPGIHNLLVAPQSSGPILKRDHNVFTDAGTPYNAYAVVGSLTLCQPGQLAELKFATTECIAQGVPVSLYAQLDEIAPVTDFYFAGLGKSTPDPTQLAPSKSIYSQRFYFSQTQRPALCRNLQLLIQWGADGIDTVQNELLSLTLFGGFAQEQ